MNLRLSSPLWDQVITFCNLSFWLKDQRWKDKVSKKSPFLLKLVPFTNHRCCCRLIQIFWHLKQLICNNNKTISLLKDIINLMKPYYSVIHISIPPSKELCSKMATGEVDVSLPWWCHTLVLPPPGYWGLFLNLIIFS